MIYVFDQIVNDSLSKVRGVGRYLQILKENFPKNTVFTDNIRQIAADSVFINPFFNFLQTPTTLKRIANKQIAVIHDLIPLKYPEHFPVGIKGKLNIFLNKLALKNYDLIVTDSEASKKDINNILYINKDKIKVIYPCLPKIFTSPLVIPSKARNPVPTKSGRKKNASLDSSVAEPALSLSNVLPQNDMGESYCLYVGDATWNKNLVNLAKAIKIINVTCVFVGNVFNPLTRNEKFIQVRTDSVKNSKTESINLESGWQKELKEFFKETKNDKRFIFLGYVSDDKLIQLYRQAKCNILVSHDEGFGFSYLEAASQSCPSVLSNVQVLREISKKQGALFANPADPNEIANAIGEVYFNKELRDRLGEAAQARTKFFSGKKFVDAFLTIL